MKRYVPYIPNAVVADAAPMLNADAAGLVKNYRQTFVGESTAIRDSAILALLANVEARKMQESQVLLAETGKLAAAEPTHSATAAFGR